MKLTSLAKVFHRLKAWWYYGSGLTKVIWMQERNPAVQRARKQGLPSCLTWPYRPKIDGQYTGRVVICPNGSIRQPDFLIPAVNGEPRKGFYYQLLPGEILAIWQKEYALADFNWILFYIDDGVMYQLNRMMYDSTHASKHQATVRRMVTTAQLDQLHQVQEALYATDPRLAYTDGERVPQKVSGWMALLGC